MQSEIKDNFYLKSQSMKHSPPNMTKTLALLQEHMKNCKIHEEIKTQKVCYSVPDKQSEGLHILFKCLDNNLMVQDVEEEGEEEVHVEPEDLID